MIPDGLKSLAPLTGTWLGRGDIHSNPWGGAGPCEGRWTMRFDPSLCHFIQDYVEKRADGSTFYGHGVVTFDKASGDFVWFWFDSYGFPPYAPARGQWTDGRLSLTKTTPRGVGRSTFELTDQGLVYFLESGASVDNLTPVMRGVYGKV